MRKLSLICLSYFLISSVSLLNAQKLVKNTLITGVCYAGNKVNRMYIPPPKEFFEKSGKKGGASVKFYYTGFPSNVIAPMEYAASILEAMLPDDAHITVLTTWAKISTSGILANSSTNGYAPGWSIDAFKPIAFYPAALAEKIAGQRLNKDSEGDITLNINSSVNWYIGTDGKPSSFQYDLVTVVIHELCHGLGFFDSFSTDATTGSYGSYSIPLIYDTFVEDIAGKKLTDTLEFLNPSTTLKTALISGRVYFNGPLIKTYTSGSRAKLWSPLVFDPGSSIAHLDEYATLPVNSLMTPYIDKSEAIHDPGKYTMSILGDLGWINTRIIHNKPKDTEEHLSEISISAEIKSDTTYDRNRVGVVWSFNGFLSSDTVYMISPQSDDNYVSTISISGYETKLEYYIFAEDNFLRTFRSPSYIDEFRYSIFIGTDTVKPFISHTQEDFYFEKIDTVRFDVYATDNLGIDTVCIEYRINEGSPGYLGLFAEGNDRYYNTIKANTLPLRAGDSLFYRIIALDKSAAANQKILPSQGYFSVKIESVNPVADSYITDFTGASGDFYNKGFEISKPANFSKYGLHTKHPYVSPEESGDSIGYIACLRTPVIFDSNGMIISYMEAVLVEPGEDGSLFGSTSFYDYVIVEGSRNFGKSWFRLLDGYDSRYMNSWETAYNSTFDGQNSNYIGKESLLLKHTIFPQPSLEFSALDTLMLRFRLFSDPYANGWGWVIEDLHIGPLVDNVEKVTYQHLILYPNPGNGLIRIKQTDAISTDQIKFSVFNSTGTWLMTDFTNGGSEMEINISGYPSGIYFIVLYLNDGFQTMKYTLIR